MHGLGAVRKVLVSRYRKTVTTVLTPDTDAFYTDAPYTDALYTDALYTDAFLGKKD